MDQEFREEMEALDRAAERAGGYVTPPWELENWEEGMKEFSRMRKYSLEHKIPITQFTKEDYQKLGIRPPERLNS